MPPPKILLYGPPGTGKTALSTTMGNGCQVIAIDNRLATCFGLKDELHSDRMSIDMIDCVEAGGVDQATSFPKIKNQLIKIVNMGQAPKCEDGTPMTGLVIDGLTTMVDSVTRYILYNAGKLGRVLPKSTNPADQFKNALSQPEWGLIINEVEQVISLARGLPIPVILTAHSVNEITPAGTTRYEISVPTKVLPPKLPGYFDEVWYMETQLGAGGVQNRVIRTVGNSMFVARSNSNLPDNTPTSKGMKELFKKMGFELPTPKAV